jgi:hypothetical protein
MEASMDAGIAVAMHVMTVFMAYLLKKLMDQQFRKQETGASSKQSIPFLSESRGCRAAGLDDDRLLSVTIKNRPRGCNELGCVNSEFESFVCVCGVCFLLDINPKIEIGRAALTGLQSSA